MPEGQRLSKEHPSPCGEIARRTGVPTSPEGETECPKGRINQKNIPRSAAKSRAAQASQLCRKAPPLLQGPQVQEGSASDIAIRKPTKKGASPSASPLACPCQENKSTSSPLQPLAAPAPEHAQAKAVRPRQRPCQTTASPRACRFLRQGPRAWKAPAAPPDSAKACRRP